MSPRVVQHRHRAVVHSAAGGALREPVIRLVRGSPSPVVDTAALARHLPGERALERQRRVQRLLHALGMPLLVGVALVAGYLIGYDGGPALQAPIVPPTVHQPANPLTIWPQDKKWPLPFVSVYREADWTDGARSHAAR